LTDTELASDSCLSLMKSIYANTTISVHSMLHIPVAIISLMKVPIRNWENSAATSCILSSCSLSQISSAISVQSDENIEAIPMRNHTRLTTQPTINHIQKRFQNTLHHFLSDNETECW